MAVVRRDRLHSTPTSGADVYSELAYAHTAGDVDTVVVDGRVVVAAGSLLTGDESAIRAEAKTKQSALIARTTWSGRKFEFWPVDGLSDRLRALAEESHG